MVPVGRENNKTEQKTNIPMSFSSSALTNTKARLKPTVTRVTRPDGKIVLERDGDTEETSESAAGFVVDTKPDLSVSQVSQGK